MERRSALIAGGSIGVAALLAACSKNESPLISAPSSTAGPSAAGTNTVAPSVAPNSTVTQMLDGSATCALTPEETEGPYYIDTDKVRADIREDRPGTRLRLALRVQDLPGCTPVANAVVEIWHCDAGGEYSGFAQQGVKNEKRFLRGAQVTNAAGIVEFTTIYPGWYRGRAVHIHFKVHTNNKTVLTSQLFFDDKLSDVVFAKAPYETGRDKLNSNDDIFDSSLLLAVRQDGDGYLAALNIGVNA